MIGRRGLVGALAAGLSTAGCGCLRAVVGSGPGSRPAAAGSADDAGGEGLARPGFGFQRLHAAGVTGAGVGVGVLDPTGFDPYHPAIADAVAAHRSFGTPDRGDGSHGVAAASVVGTVAPDAELYLGGYADGRTYRQALEWLDGRTGVVVVPASFYGRPDDGTGPVTRATRALATGEGDRGGAVVVAAAGNLARRHWVGRLEEGTPVGASPRLRVSGATLRRVALWLAAEGREEDHRLALVPERATEPVATGSGYPADGVPNRRLSASVPPGTYRVEVGGPPSVDGRVAVTSLVQPLSGAEPAGSVAAPATAEPVLSIGAYADGGVAPFSSRGPTADGRRGVDLVAPSAVWSTEGRLTGSSAAAAYVGGVAALARSATDAGADRIRAALRTTARDVADPGPDPAAGHGLIVPEAAVRRLRGGDRDR